MEFHPDSPQRRLPPLYYRCPNCHREIKFAQVEEMGQIDGDVFSLSHNCGCNEGHTYKYMCEVEHTALMRLLGGFRPVLPYRAAPLKALPLRPPEERQALLFAWDVMHLSGVEEFLLFCGGPIPQ